MPTRRAQARVLDGGNALIVTAQPSATTRGRRRRDAALPDADGRVDLAALLRALGERGINELHVEAGAKLNGALLARRAGRRVRALPRAAR